MSLIDVSYKIGKKYILRNISLDIYEREFLVVSGWNGEGKSTLLRIMSGNLTPTQGSVHKLKNTAKIAFCSQ